VAVFTERPLPADTTLNGVSVYFSDKRIGTVWHSNIWGWQWAYWLEEGWIGAQCATRSEGFCNIRTSYANNNSPFSDKGYDYSARPFKAYTGAGFTEIPSEDSLLGEYDNFGDAERAVSENAIGFGFIWHSDKQTLWRDNGEGWDVCDVDSAKMVFDLDGIAIGLGRGSLGLRRKQTGKVN